jgi:hypothetical protein
MKFRVGERVEVVSGMSPGWSATIAELQPPDGYRVAFFYKRKPDAVRVGFFPEDRLRAYTGT